jgi:hypothetical protein
MYSPRKQRIESPEPQGFRQLQRKAPTMGKSRAVLDGYWNPKRRAITWRIGKRGTNAFYLLSPEDLPGLYEQLGRAIEGRNSPGVPA